MKKIFAFIGLFFALVYPCFAIQFDQEVADLFKSTLIKSAKDIEQLPPENRKGMAVICQDLAEELKREGVNAFTQAGEAVKIHEEVWSAIRRRSDFQEKLKSAQSSDMTRSRSIHNLSSDTSGDSKERWDQFRKTALYAAVEELERRGLHFPPKLPAPMKDQFLLNQKMDPHLDKALVRAAFMLLYTPRQVQREFEKHRSQN